MPTKCEDCKEEGNYDASFVDTYCPPDIMRKHCPSHKNTPPNTCTKCGTALICPECDADIITELARDTGRVMLDAKGDAHD